MSGSSVVGLVVILVIAALAGLQLIARSLRRYRAGARADLLAPVAARLGWTFEAEDDELLRSLAVLSAFEHGENRHARSVMTGRRDARTIRVFDHLCGLDADAGAPRVVQAQTVVHVRAEDVHLPRMQLTPENLLDKLVEALGGMDIDFDSHPAFSSAYRLRGSDEEDVRARFGPKVLDFFEGHRGLVVEAFVHDLIVFRPGRLVAPDKVEQAIDEALTVLGLLAAQTP